MSLQYPWCVPALSMLYLSIVGYGLSCPFGPIELSSFSSIRRSTEFDVAVGASSFCRNPSFVSSILLNVVHFCMFVQFVLHCLIVIVALVPSQDERIQHVLGHFQKDFEGGVSAENLGKFVHCSMCQQIFFLDGHVK